MTTTWTIRFDFVARHYLSEAGENFCAALHDHINDLFLDSSQGMDFIQFRYHQFLNTHAPKIVDMCSDPLSLIFSKKQLDEGLQLITQFAEKQNSDHEFCTYYWEWVDDFDFLPD